MSIDGCIANALQLKERGNFELRSMGNFVGAMVFYTDALGALDPISHFPESLGARVAILRNRCRCNRKLGRLRDAYQDALAAVEGDNTGVGHCLLGRCLREMAAEATSEGKGSVILDRDSVPLRIEEVQLRALRAFYMATQKSSRKEEFMDDYRSARKAYYLAVAASQRATMRSRVGAVYDALVEIDSLRERNTGTSAKQVPMEMDLADGGGVLVRDQQSEGRRRVEAAARRENALTSLAVLQTYLEDEEVIRHLSLSSGGNERCPDAPKPFGVEVPLCFQCPLSMAMYREPVILQSSEDPKLVSQHSYERSMIADVFRRVAQGEEFVDPSTRVSYGKRHPHLLPNHALKQAVSAYLQCYPHLFEK